MKRRIKLKLLSQDICKKTNQVWTAGVLSGGSHENRIQGVLANWAQLSFFWQIGIVKFFFGKLGSVKFFGKLGSVKFFFVGQIGLSKVFCGKLGSVKFFFGKLGPVKFFGKLGLVKFFWQIGHR